MWVRCEPRGDRITQHLFRVCRIALLLESHGFSRGRFKHPTVYDINEIYQSKTPFEAGVKLHVWLDNIREKFIPQEGYDEVTPHAEGFSATLLKFIEEKILSDFYDGRAWSFYFDKVLPEELSFTKEESVSKWHGIIQWTMWVRPSNLLWAQSYRGPLFGVSANTLYNWSYLLPPIQV